MPLILPAPPLPLPEPLPLPGPPPPGGPVPSPLGIISPPEKVTCILCYIGGSPHVPVEQVGQLISEALGALELGLKNEETSRFGFLALHLGQSNLELSSPMD